jgi:hypothetical protein
MLRLSTIMGLRTAVQQRPDEQLFSPPLTSAPHWRYCVDKEASDMPLPPVRYYALFYATF